MEKTTIDGLKVRTSAKKPVRVSTAQGSRRRVAQVRRAAPARKQGPATQNLRRMRQMQSDFLAPVKSLELPAPEPTPTEGWMDNWLEDSPQTSGENWGDLLNDWGGKDDDSLAAALEREEAEAGEKPHRKHKTARQRHRKRKIVKRVVLITLSAALIGGGAWLYFWGDNLIQKLTGGKSGFWSTLSAFVSDAIPFDTDSKGRTNILVFGTEGYDMSGTSGDGQHAGAQLTDSIMAISFDQETKDVALISLPRDLKVSMACSAGKINEVFYCHNANGEDEEAGAKALMRQVGEVLGLDFQYYAHVNWASLIDIVNTIGGITVTLDEDINDSEWTGAIAKAGVPIEVNGEQALGLARARHGTTGGDFTRGNTQQKIIMAIVEKLMQRGVNAAEAVNLLNILGDNLRTNCSTDNVKAAVALAAGFNLDAVKQIPLVDYDNNVFYVTTATINDISYVVPSKGVGDYSAIQQYVEEKIWPPEVPEEIEEEETEVEM